MDHSGFSPPDSNHTTATMDSDVSGVSLSQIDNTASAPMAVFQVIDSNRERQVRSRSTTPRHTPMQTQDLSMHQEQHTNISTEVHNQLMMLSQQVSHVMQQQQQNNTSISFNKCLMFKQLTTQQSSTYYVT